MAYARCSNPSRYFQPAPDEKKFLQHVINGQCNEAENMLKNATRASRFTLLTTSEVTENLEQTICIDGTGLQAAFCLNDIKMAKMLITYIDKCPNGAYLKLQQINEQFPEGWEDADKEQKIKDNKALHETFNMLLDHSTNNGECKAALAQFKEYLTPKTPLSTGKHTHADMLIKAINLCHIYRIKEYESFSEAQDHFLEVLNDILLHLPACHIHTLCNQIWNSVACGYVVQVPGIAFGIYPEILPPSYDGTRPKKISFEIRDSGIHIKATIIDQFENNHTYTANATICYNLKTPTQDMADLINPEAKNRCVIS